MKKILFATTNQSKLKRFSKGLLENEVEIVSLKDLNLELNVDENGNNVIENALVKARAAYQLTKMPVMGMDDSLYLENVPEKLQPGLFVRRVNGKTLSDEEMVDHYLNLVNQYGVNGKINCKWVYGLAVIDEFGKEHTYTWEKADFYMTNEKSELMNPGYPLNSISKYKVNDKFFTEVTDEEKESLKVNEDHVIAFILKSINK